MKRVLSKPAVRLGLLLLLLLLLVLVVGAGIVAYTQTQNTAFSYADLLAALHSRGATVQERGAASWSVTFQGADHHHQLSVNGAQVDAYEYATTSAAQADAGRVSSNGSTFRVDSGPYGSSVVNVDWDAPPHHYRRGRVIVSYIGDDRAIIGLLTAVLGLQFAGGSMPADYVWLLDRLRTAGASVALIDHRPNQAPIAGTLPVADAYDVQVNNAAVMSIFEFADGRPAGTYAHHIQGGNYVDTDPAAHTSIVVEYAAQPHFYLTDTIIVLYVGADGQTLRLLASILGQPFTEGPV
jgi:hypothetical protein